MYAVLIVDDEPIIRNSIRALLERMQDPRLGEIRCCANAEEALSMSRSFQPQIVITDIMMDGLNGIDLIVRLRDLLPDAGFLVVSGYDDFAFVRSAFTSGAVDYLLKPLLYPQLKKAVEKICANLDRAQTEPPPSKGDYVPLIDLIRQYIEENYHRKLMLSEISEHFGVSYAHLSHVISTTLKMSFSEYVTQVRMRHASHLLNDPTRNIQEVAAMTGYDNPFTFSRAFKKHFGVSPNNYRKEKNRDSET